MRFTIPADHPSLAGHFPGRPVVPGVLVLDRVLDAIEASAGMPHDGLRLPQVKFLQPLLPMQEARVELEAAAADASPRWRFKVLRDDSLIATGEVVPAAAASSGPTVPGAPA